MYFKRRPESLGPKDEQNVNGGSLKKQVLAAEGSAYHQKIRRNFSENLSSLHHGHITLRGLMISYGLGGVKGNFPEILRN